MNNYSGGEWQFWQFLRVKNKRPRLITMGWMKKKKEKRRKQKKKRKDDNRTFENDRRKNRSIYEQNLIIVSVAAKDDQE